MRSISHLLNVHVQESNGVTPVMYIPSWFLTAFTLSLPWSSVLRLWDVFYFEGQCLLNTLQMSHYKTTELMLIFVPIIRCKGVLPDQLGDIRNL